MASKFDFCDTQIEIKPPGQRKRYISEIIWYEELERKSQELKQINIPDFPDKVIKDIIVSVDEENQQEDRTRWNVEGFTVDIIKFNLDTEQAEVAWVEFWEISQSPLFFYIESAYQQTIGTLLVQWG